MGAVDECVDELERVYATTRIYDVRVVEVGEPQVSPSEREVSLIVKSVHEPSVDEIPLLTALMERFSFSEVYEYERIAEAPEGDRADHLARFLSEALSMGRGVILVAPNLIGVSLAGRLPEETLDELDQDALAQVSVRAEGTLYLPLREAVDEASIEIVGKSNSESSGERAKWLLSEARRRGLRATSAQFLPDNRTITEYVTSIGSRGYLYRVPVTKLASVLVAVDRCLERNEVEEIRRPESASHTVYAIRLSEGQLKALREALSSLINLRRGELVSRLSPGLEPYFEKGAREVMAEVLRRLGAI
ncbi:MAG: hypothetical protein ACP5HK_00670 [Acidilobus sp.]